MSGGPLSALLTAGLLLALCSSIRAETADLKVGLFDMPPFYSQDDQGNPTGELITTLDRVTGALELSWEPHFTTPPEALKGLVNGDLDLLMVIRHPMLKSRAIYGGVPMARMELMAFHGPATGRVASLEDLRGQRVALLRGYGYGGLIGQLMVPESGIQLEVADSHQQAFRWLNQSKVDHVLDYRRPGQRAVRSLQLSGIEADRLQQVDVYFVVSAKLAGGQELLNRMDETLTQLNP